MRTDVNTEGYAVRELSHRAAVRKFGYVEVNVARFSRIGRFTRIGLLRGMDAAYSFLPSFLCASYLFRPSSKSFSSSSVVIRRGGTSAGLPILSKDT